MSAPLDRRAFVGRGSALALGALVAVPSALHATEPLVAPTRPADTVLAAQIAAILDRPIPDYFPNERACDCRACEAIRARGYTCAECGFVGTPIVEPCECREARASNIAAMRSVIAELEAGIVRAGGYGLDSLPYLRRDLAINEARPDRMCRASAKESNRKRQHPWCAHGMTWCPTCANMDYEGSTLDGPEHFLERLREVRALLARHKRTAL